MLNTFTRLAPALVLLLAVPRAFAQEPASEAARLRQESMSLYRNKDYHAALERLQQIVSKKEFIDTIKQPDRVGVFYDIACLLALEGKKDEALQALRVAFKEGFSDVEHARTDSDFDSIRSDPRFEEILRGDPEAAKKAEQTALESLKLEFPYKTIDGADFDWGKVKGKAVALVINGTWHSQMKKAAPFLVKFLEDNKAKGFDIVSLQFELLPIDDENIGDAKKFRDEFKVTWPMLYAGDFDAIPTVLPFLNDETRRKHPIIIFFDRKGKARQMLVDKLDEKAFTEAVNALLAEPR